jgi:hypothetical protein
VKPYSEISTIILKDEGKKVALPKETNQLMIDENGECKEIEIVEKILEEEDPPTELVRRQLEALAVQILNIKNSEAGE